jgi:hypothetical protein
MSIADEKFQQLTEMVQQGIKAQEPRERSEAEEDQIALELFILEHEGPESLAEYLANPTKKCLRYADLPPYQREIIAGARMNKRDFPRPAPRGVYAPRPAAPKDNCGGRCMI